MPINNPAANVSLSNVDPVTGRGSIQAQKYGVIKRNLFQGDLSTCTALPLRIIPSTVQQCTGVTTIGSNTGNAAFAVAGAIAGRSGSLIPKKLFVALGPTLVTNAELSATVTSANRITAAAGTPFSTVAQGDVFYSNDGGSNTSPRGQYRVTAMGGAGAWIELLSIVPTGILVNEGPVTFDFVIYKGAYGINSTLNGFPAAGRTDNYGLTNFPLQMLSSAAGSFVGVGPGLTQNMSGGACQLFEATVGDDGYGTGNGPDGFGKTPSMKLYRMFKVDFNGIKQVTLPGNDYGLKHIQGAANGSTEFFFGVLECSNPNPLNNPSEATLNQLRGRTITFGYQCEPGAANAARLYFYDGSTVTFGDYFDNVTFDQNDISKTFKTMTVTVPIAATRVQFGIARTGNKGDIWYSTQPMAAYGTELRPEDYTAPSGYIGFCVHPNFAQGYVNGSVPFSRQVRIELESCGSLSATPRAIFSALEGRWTKPGDFGNNFSPSAAVGESVAMNLPAITMIQPQNRVPYIFSSGTNIPANVTRYVGIGQFSSVYNNPAIGLKAGFTGYTMNMYCQFSLPPGAGNSITATLQINGVDTNLTGTVTGDATAFSSDGPVSLYNAIAPNDYLTIKVVTSASAAAASLQATVGINIYSLNLNANSAIVPLGSQSENGSTSIYTKVMYLFVSANNSLVGVNIDMFGLEY